MAEKGIREHQAKRLLAKCTGKEYEGVLVTKESPLPSLARLHPWLKAKKLVVKPDQLFGKRKKHDLVLLNASFGEAETFIAAHIGKELTIDNITGTITHFLVEPYVEHSKEIYLAFTTEQETDVILFSEEGGIDIEHNWASIKRFEIPVLEQFNKKRFSETIASIEKKELFVSFVDVVYAAFVDLGFTFLEFNPLTISDDGVILLDVVDKLDECSSFENMKKWGNLEFPGQFGRTLTKDEVFIAGLDAKSGASLKLTVLNPRGRIWLLASGGGASVVLADTIANLGAAKELGNYGEYSGDPSTDETYEYTKTVLGLMLNHPAKSKALLIAGGIANFTDVAKTFTGIIKAIKEKQDDILKANVKIFVRRAGPNYAAGLENMRLLGEELGIPIEVHGPEMMMTAIIPLAISWVRQ